MASETRPVLAVDGLCAGYGAINVLTDVGIAVRERESVAIVGSNGAGKSTLVRAICGLLPVSRGTIVKDGVEIQRLPPHRRASVGIGVVLENRQLFGELSVRSNLELAAANARAGGHRAIDFALDDVLELFPFMRERLDAPVELLSGGEQQMVAVGRALLLRPDLLILDEPSIGLAPKVVKDIVRVIASLRARGMSLLLIEQNIAIAAECSDRAYILSLGRNAGEVPVGAWDTFMREKVLEKAYFGG